MSKLIDLIMGEQDCAGQAFAVLTAAGKAARKRMWPVYQGAIRELFEEGITETEAAAMGKAFKCLLERAGSETAPGASAEQR